MLAPTFTGLTPPGSSLNLLTPEVVAPSNAQSVASPVTPVTVSEPVPAPTAAPVSTMTPSASVSSVPSATSNAAAQPVSATATNTAGVTWVVPEAQKSVSAGHFANLDKSGSGAIGGAEAKEFFLRSQLPAPELAKIWALSDVNADGKLSLPEFQVAFFLTQQRSKQVDIPTNLPASLYESVGLMPPPTAISPSHASPVTSPSHSEAGSTANSKTNSLMDVPAHNASAVDVSSPIVSHSGSTASMGDLHAHSSSPLSSSSHSMNINVSGSAAKLPEIREETAIASPASRVPPSTSSPVHMATPPVTTPHGNQDFRLTMRMDPSQLKAALEAEAAGNPTYMPTASGAPSSIPAHLQTTSASSDDWLITPDVKSTYELYFAKADELQSGYVSGPRARELFTKASLPNNVLAEIWALSDMNHDGQLDKAEFCIAMHLINLARRGIKPPVTLPMHMIESAGVNPQFIAEMKNRAQRERDEAEAKLKAELEAQAVQARQHQIYLEQQAEMRRQEEDRRRQEEERQEVNRMKQQIVAMLKEKEHFVRLLRQQQQYNIGVAQQLLKVDNEAEALRNDVSSMEMQVEKLKIKGASVKEHSETLMRHLTAATEDKATLDALLNQRRTQYMTEAAAVQTMEAQLDENMKAFARQTQDIAALRASVAALKKANDERASRAFDPAVLQQKLQQEKLRQDFARATSSSSLTTSANATATTTTTNNNNATATNSSSTATLPRGDSPARARVGSGFATPGSNGQSSKTNSTADFAAFPATSGGDDWAAFNDVPASTSTPAPTQIDDFDTQPGTTPSARPKSFGFEDEQDEFGKPAPRSSGAASTATPTKPAKDLPHPDDDFAPSPSQTPPQLANPDEDFFSGQASPAPQLTAPKVVITEPSPQLPPKNNTNTNPFPVEEELSSPRNKTPTPTPSDANADASHPNHDDDFFSGPNPTDPASKTQQSELTSSDAAPASSPTPPLPASSEIAAPASEPVAATTTTASAQATEPASTNPFPSSDDTSNETNGTPAVSEATSKAFDDLFADVPATETSVTFGSADD